MLQAGALFIERDPRVTCLPFHFISLFSQPLNAKRLTECEGYEKGVFI